MKPLRRLIPSLVLGLTVAVAGVSFAQSANQAGGDDKHSCCGMTSGCCGDSCQMKEDGMKKHSTSTDKAGCSGCCGDSCQMKKKDGAKNHAISSDKEGGCCGDSCQMKKKDGAKTTATTTPASDKHECCCCGDSCNMKHAKTEKP